VIVGDIWVDTDRLNQTAQDRLGYPTQKLMELLERIICASTNGGDTILDPFYGYGTIIDSPQHQKRKWIGVDVTYISIGLINSRLRGAYGDHIKEIYVIR
jgi:DNA modification methylase